MEETRKEGKVRVVDEDQIMVGAYRGIAPTKWCNPSSPRRQTNALEALLQARSPI